MADSCHLENRKIAISHDNAKLVSLAYWRSASYISEFKFFLTTVHFRNVFCIIMPNFVKIGRAIASSHGCSSVVVLLRVCGQYV